MRKEGKEVRQTFVSTLPEIAKGVFIGINDSRMDRRKKEEAGFYVLEEPGWPANQIANMMKAQGGIGVWMRRSEHFESLIHLVAAGIDVLNGSEYSEAELRLAFFSNAQDKISVLVKGMAERKLLGEAQGTEEKNLCPLSEIEVKIAGLEAFKKELLA